MTGGLPGTGMMPNESQQFAGGGVSRLPAPGPTPNAAGGIPMAPPSGIGPGSMPPNQNPFGGIPVGRNLRPPAPMNPGTQPGGIPMTPPTQNRPPAPVRPPVNQVGPSASMNPNLNRKPPVKVSNPTGNK